jgi:hypothetical protein
MMRTRPHLVKKKKKKKKKKSDLLFVEDEKNPCEPACHFKTLALTVRCHLVVDQALK